MYYKPVLILVLVEHTLGVDGDVIIMPASLEVLILVLVEHTLGVSKQETVLMPTSQCLNPCFSGTYPRRIQKSIN